MSIMKKIVNYFKKSWNNAVAFNAFCPSGMIPFNYVQVSK